MEIGFSQKWTVLVDDEDVKIVHAYTWCIVSHGKEHKRLYVMAKCHGETLYLHRLIMQTPDGMDTDHINGNGLDNRRRNLRIVSRSNNMRNAHTKPKSNKTSRYKGVSWWVNKRLKSGGYWKAEIELPNRKRIVKYFHTELDAACCYDALAVLHFGEHARVNGV